MPWQSCGNIAMNGTNGIDRDYTMIVCLDVVDFGGHGSGYLGRFVCSCDSGDVGIVTPSVLVLGSVAELVGRTLCDSFLRICHDIL